MTESIQPISPFPFELILSGAKGQSNTELFVATVEQVLGEELQAPASFGCKISNCHTHVGSKKHLGFFVEAELLFHNSYYNKGFAYLTAQKIMERADGFEHILMVGCETFCELFLCEACDFLNNKDADYCIYETTGSKHGRIRRLREWAANQDHRLNNTLLVFIVPISTTLTTHDKLIATFHQYLGEYLKKDVPAPQFQAEFEKAKTMALNFALIVIGDPDAPVPYWTINPENRTLKPVTNESLFQELAQESTVHYFAKTNSPWYEIELCPHCFPDVDQRKIVEEQPIFGVNRASVVPMLQLNINHPPKPRLEPWPDPQDVDNLRRVIRLSQYMHHHHLLRNTNHFQYYFDSDTFFQNNRQDIRQWLNTKVRPQINCVGDKYSEARYHIIVAPRHSSNANFVHMVNDVVFDGTARIFYFDVQREYRGNIKAKYSDFSRFIKNLDVCGHKYIIHFHFVDDSIYLGTNFSRTQNLIQTLTEQSPNDKIRLYHSVILLIGRNSKETKRFLLDDISNFYEYVHLAISPMRSHEDACTLCQLTHNYMVMSDNCSTNQVNRFCREKIRDHRLVSVDEYLEDSNHDFAEFGKQMRVILRHIIALCLDNRLAVKKNGEVFNKEKPNDVKRLLEDIYRDLAQKKGTIASLYEEETNGVHFDSLEARISLIKVISRPFFTYNIRQKQGAFQFCLETLDKELERKAKKTKIIIALLNALSDMEANYILRAQTFNKIYACDDTLVDSGIHNAFFNAVEKMIAFSMDSSKSLLLENILVSGGEESFFTPKKPDFHGDSLTVPIGLQHWFELYLENNRLLREGFADIFRSEKYDILQTTPYYLQQFRKVFELNMGRSLSENGLPLVKCYCRLIEALQKSYSSGDHSIVDGKYFGEISSHIHAILQQAGVPLNGDILLFVTREAQSIAQEEQLSDFQTKYVLLWGDDAAYNKFAEIDFQDRVQKLLSPAANSIMDTLFYDKDEPCCVVKFVSSYSLVTLAEDPVDVVLWNAPYNDIPYSVYLYIPLEEGHAPEKLWRTIKGDNHYDKRGTEFLALAFGLKILLSLRKEFAKMIAVNFSNDSIQRLVLEAERSEALAISKANRHGAVKYYSALNYKTVRLAMDNEKYKDLLDNYLQLMANDFIASLYRDACSSALNKLTDEDLSFDVWNPVREEDQCKHEMYRLLLHETCGDDEYCYTLSGPCKTNAHNTSPAQLRIIIQGLKPGQRWEMMCLGRDDSSIGPTLLLIYLLATNARFHMSNTIEECEVRVYREGYYLCAENAFDNAKNIVQDVNAKLELHPHHLPQKSITLWSLKQYCATLKRIRYMYSTQAAPADSPFVIDSPDGKVFRVKMMLFDGNEVS